MRVSSALLLACLSVASGLSKNRMEDHLVNYLNQFLILRNTQKFCEHKDLLSANDKDSFFPLSRVLNTCQDMQTCTFISFSPIRKLRNSIHYQHDEALENTGVNWICSGDEWVNARTRKHWISAVKKKNIQDQMNSYAIRLNTKGDCDSRHVLKRIDQFVSPKEAAQQCNQMEGCHHIIFNYNRRYGTVDKSVGDGTVLCSEPPVNRSTELGYLVADKNERDVAHEASRRKNPNVQKFPGAVVTPDAYYKSYNKGETVHPAVV